MILDGAELLYGKDSERYELNKKNSLHYLEEEGFATVFCLLLT